MKRVGNEGVKEIRKGVNREAMVHAVRAVLCRRVGIGEVVQARPDSSN